MSRIDKIRQRSDAKRNGRDTAIHPSVATATCLAPSCCSLWLNLILMAFCALFLFLLIRLCQVFM